MAEEVQATATDAMKRCQIDAEHSSDEITRKTSWAKWLGMMFAGNAGLELENEALQSPAGSSSRPPRRLSILKNDRVHPDTIIDTNLISNGEATKDTVYMLRCLVMSDFFSGDDRGDLGLPASGSGSHHNTSLFQPDSPNVAVEAVKPPPHHVNLEDTKEEEWGEGKEQLLADVAPAEANERHPTQPPTRDANASVTSESLSSHTKALRSLQALASTSAPTTRTHSTGDCDIQPSSTTEEEPNRFEMKLLAQYNEEVGGILTNQEHQSQTTFESAMLPIYTPRGNISPPSNEKTIAGRNVDVVSFLDSFDTMNSMPSTGTFRDTRKRFVPTLAKSPESQDSKTMNDSWSRNLKEKPCSNDATPPLNAIERMLKQKDFFPSTGTFQDSAKRHVRTRSGTDQERDVMPRNAGHVRAKSGSNQDWDTRPRNVDMGATLSRPLPSAESFSNFLQDMGSFLSTGSFRDTDKRHVRHVTEPIPNQEWGLGQKSSTGPFQREAGIPPEVAEITAAAKDELLAVEKAAAPPLADSVSNFLQDSSILSLPSTGTFRDTEKRHVRHITEPIPNQEWGLEHKNDTKMALTRSFTGPFQLEAGTPPEEAELGELLVDWGNQGTSS